MRVTNEQAYSILAALTMANSQIEENIILLNAPESSPKNITELNQLKQIATEFQDLQKYLKASL